MITYVCVGGIRGFCVSQEIQGSPELVMIKLKYEGLIEAN